MKEFRIVTIFKSFMFVIIQIEEALLQTEAIKFLYACLEDIELERIAKLPIESISTR